MREFLLGALTTTSLAAALIFLRYWRMGHDRLLLFFSLAFTAMGANWLAIAAVGPAYAYQDFEYLPRLLAFALIIAGIVDKNRRSRRG